MKIDIIRKSKLTIGDLHKGATFTWADISENVFMIIEGEGIQGNDSYKHAVNLRTGGVIELGVDCSILRVDTTEVIGTVIY